MNDHGQLADYGGCRAQSLSQQVDPKKKSSTEGWRCYCTTLELNTHTHKAGMQITPSQRVYSSVSVGTWVAQAAELCYHEVPVMKQLQPGPEETHQSLHFIYVFYLLPPKIKINMCQTGDV